MRVADAIALAAAAKGRLFGHRLEGQWLHVGTPEAIVEAVLASVETP